MYIPGLQIALEAEPAHVLHLAMDYLKLRFSSSANSALTFLLLLTNTLHFVTAVADIDVVRGRRYSQIVGAATGAKNIPLWYEYYNSCDTR